MEAVKQVAADLIGFRYPPTKSLLIRWGDASGNGNGTGTGYGDGNQVGNGFGCGNGVAADDVNPGIVAYAGNGFDLSPNNHGTGDGTGYGPGFSTGSGSGGPYHNTLEGMLTWMESHGSE
jgi:hypothetical protein